MAIDKWRQLYIVFDHLLSVMSTTTIHVSRETKEKLDSLKVHPREPYEDVIVRLLQFYEKYRDVVEKLEKEGGGRS